MNYGSVWVDLQGTSIQPDELPILRHPNTGGVLLFTKNFLNKTQLIDLVKSLRDAAAKPILVSVDHEGGRIWRFREGFTRPAAAREYGNLYKTEPERALSELTQAGETVARELIECDIDLTFAPVLDIDHGISSVIGDRSYSSDPNIVSICARAFIKGMRDAGMGAVGKHFPGHGGCTMDSHFTAAEDMRSFAEIVNQDLVPFIDLKDLLTGVMPAHVKYSAVDQDPAGFSKFWLQEVLRQQIGFKGAIISDCLSMHGSGFVDNLVEGAHRAFEAGCDMVIAAQQNRAYLLQVLDQISWQTDKQQQQRIHGLAKQVEAQMASI